MSLSLTTFIQSALSTSFSSFPLLSLLRFFEHPKKCGAIFDYVVLSSTTSFELSGLDVQLKGIALLAPIKRKRRRKV